jgi:hypothetical protein
LSGTELVTQIVQIIVSGITEMGKGIGSGISGAVQAMAFTTSGETTTMSVWFIVVLAFAGISLAVGLTRLVYTFLTTLGK